MVSLQIWGSLISLLQARTGSGPTSTAQLHGQALLGTWDAKGLLHRGRGGDTSISVALLGLFLASGEDMSLAPYLGAMAHLTPLTPVTPRSWAPR